MNHQDDRDDVVEPSSTPHLMDPSSSHDVDPDEEEECHSNQAATAAVDGEEAIIHALGISYTDVPVKTQTTPLQDEAYRVVPNPVADEVDLSDLRGTKAPTTGADRMATMKDDGNSNNDLDALAEILPELRSRTSKESSPEHIMNMDAPALVPETKEVHFEGEEEQFQAHDSPIEVVEHTSTQFEVKAEPEPKDLARESIQTNPSASARAGANMTDVEGLQNTDSLKVQESKGSDDCDAENRPGKPSVELSAAIPLAVDEDVHSNSAVSSTSDVEGNAHIGPYRTEDQNLGGFDDADSEEAVDSDAAREDTNEATSVARKPAAFTSAASLSTATQTHEVRMPMYLPTFKPATGCTNASDFIVRCFVARLRSGITVVKHGRSRWCKSRLRILHIHPDGRSLSWKPAVGEPSSSKRPPKLDLSTCSEVRHAWSPDPLNPMFTGTPILRQKCEAANAHKSFALIFPKRTVDITAVTADQCKVLMEGFSALCFRLQVANLAGRNSKKGRDVRSDEEEATTASATLTNNSAQLSPPGGGTNAKVKRHAYH